MSRNLVPSIRYADAPAAIDFLCSAFGFQTHAVYVDETDKSLVHHAQLTLDDGMIMLGSARPDQATGLYGWKTPAEAAGTTMSIYVYVPDADAHWARAKDAGAEIITAPHDNEGYPGRGYAARDSEGHVWNFGSYDPWAR